MLFFIDESWQTVGGREVGALGGVLIPEPRYNNFCREVFAFKRDILGAEELIDAELKGNSCFAKSAFKKRNATGHSRLLESAEKMFGAVKRHEGKVFLIWTSDPGLSLLNNPDSEDLSKPYRQRISARPTATPGQEHQASRMMAKNWGPASRSSITPLIAAHRPLCRQVSTAGEDQRPLGWSTTLSRWLERYVEVFDTAD
jgi:hypothetical protein